MLQLLTEAALSQTGGEAIGWAESIEKLSIIGILALAAMAGWWMWYQERKENKILHAASREDAKEVTTLMVTTRASLDANTKTIEALTSALVAKVQGGG